MNTATVRALANLTSDFYRAHAASFSATREAGWPGWDRVAAAAEHLLLSTEQPARVFDLACGNLRFERYLHRRFAGQPFAVTAWDNCDELAQCAPQTDTAFYRLDIIETLMARSGCKGAGNLPPNTDCARAWLQPGLAPAHHLSVCFGFMHHIPSLELRQCAVDLLLDATLPGGLLAISFWQFMDEPKLAAKANEGDRHLAEHGIDQNDLDTGDHALGWQDDHSHLRYCHHTSEAELDRLCNHVSHRAEELARFSADGKSGKLNHYLLLRKLD